MEEKDIDIDFGFEIILLILIAFMSPQLINDEKTIQKLKERLEGMKKIKHSNDNRPHPKP